RSCLYRDFVFFNDTATTDIYTLPYTPLFRSCVICVHVRFVCVCVCVCVCVRSEEHTSALQSHLNLVCRLLLEKKVYLSVVYSVLLFDCVFGSDERVSARR